MEGTTLSHFRILEKLGEGGMGIVYRAEDTNLGRAVALKLLRPGYVENDERRARFKREARTAAAVSHPNIATIHEIDDADGTTFIAMELIEGASLRTLLAQGPLAIPEALRIASDVAAGLSKAHEAGVIHRDLKPDNVMVTGDGHVKILDFGLAKLLDPTSATSERELSEMETVAQDLTREGRVFGTAAYMSPEQARGHVVDTRSDLFSFGAMLYEMVTGTAPFRGQSISDTISSVLRDAVVPAIERNPNVPPELDRILARLLQKDAGERYQSSRDLMLELRQLARSTDSASYSTEVTPPGGHHVGHAAHQTPSSGSATSYGSGGYGAATTPSGGHAARPPSGPMPAGAGSRGPWRAVLISGVAVVAIIVIGVLGSIVRPLLAGREGPSSPGIPAADAPEPGVLAVHPLENLKDPSDPDRLGQILQELVITDLSSVEPLRVFSSQRLYDVQKLLTGRDDRIYDRETATDVAQYAGAELMLTGTISQLGSRWIIVSQLVDVESGTISASERIDGSDLYEMVDQLTARIRGRLDLASAPASGVDKDVREMTTASIEAYQYYLRGMELLNDQSFVEAVAVLDSAIAIDPSFSRAYYSVAVAHWWANDGTEAAREPLQKLLSGDLEITEKERRMAEGAYLLVDRQYDEALPVFERLAAAYPDEKDVWYMLGECFYHRSEPDRTRALRAFVRSVKLDPQFFLGYRHIFDIYDANAMTDDALDLSRVLVELDPDDPEHYSRWVQYTAIAGDEEKLAAAIDEATARFPDALEHATLMVGVGHAFHRTGRLEEARDAYEEALGAGGDEVSTQVELGLARVSLGRIEPDAAERRLRALYASTSGDDRMQVFRELAELYFVRGRWDMGLELVESFVESDGDTSWIGVPIAGFEALSPGGISKERVAALAEGDLPALRAEVFDLVALGHEYCADHEAAGYYLAVLDSLRPDPRGNDVTQRAENAVALGDPAQAETILSRALAESPGSSALLLQLADVALLRGNTEEAAAFAERSVELGPRGKRSRRMLIRAHLQGGRLLEADAALGAAREALAPRLFAWALAGGRGSLSRGVVFAYARAGDMTRAQELVAEAATHLPDDPDVRHAEGWLALARGELDAAERAFVRARELGPSPSFEDLRARIGLAVTRLTAGDAAAAERIVREAIETGPRHARLHRLMAYVLMARERTDEALAHAQRAFDMDPGPESHAAMGWVLVAGGVDVARGASLATVAEGAPPSWELPFVLPYVAPPSHTRGLAALREGRIAEAVARLEAAGRDHPERTSIARHLTEARAAQREGG